LICGASGSGKSLLLSAIIGEAELVSGKICIPMTSAPESQKSLQRTPATNWLEEKTVAYVAQVPWIENCSLKDNIFSGLPYVESRYKETLVAAALMLDIEVLEDGDLTEVGS
jgi:ABC-type multidrug transport system fused ATPase/permease subunit